MTETRKIIRMFLASPGDLTDERKSIRTVVEEVNTNLANRIGYHVELMGWEDTVSRYGRPQAIINQEVDRCDLFVGMMWKRWGTPPDTSGEYSSGFQEEFERSMDRRKNRGKPEISLFFKEIDQQFLEDKGPDLERVLEFKEEIIRGKSVLFQSFSSSYQIESLVRACISELLFRIRDAEGSEVDKSTDKQTKTRSTAEQSDTDPPKESPISPQGCRFLDDFADRIRNAKGLDGFSACDIARFRLLANSVSRRGNDTSLLGVHDLNILFASKDKCDFGPAERIKLAKSGFENLVHENVPLWHWYTSAMNPPHYCALVSSIIGKTDNEKVGAIRALDQLGMEVSEKLGGLDRKQVLELWLSKGSSTEVKNVAMKYIANNGCFEDLGILRAEYELNSNYTARSSLEAMLRLLHRTGKTGAAEKLVLEAQFNTLDSIVLHDALEGFHGLQTEELLDGLVHRNARVRLRAVRILGERGIIAGEVAKKLLQDDDAAVRCEVFSIQENLGESFSEEEAKSMLVKPQKAPSSGLPPSFGFFRAQPITLLADKEGEQYFRQFKYKRLHRLSERVLLSSVREANLYDDMAYFVLAEKYFSKYAAELRANVDEKFKQYFKVRVERVRKFGTDPKVDDLVKKAMELEGNTRRILTRKGLDVLCRKLKSKDTVRIRENLKTGYTGESILDAEYFEKNGEWTDIQLLANAHGPKSDETLLFSSSDQGFQDAVSTAIYKIGKGTISDLCSMELPSIITEKLLSVCSESVFRTISDGAFSKLLSCEVDGVRKAASILAVRAFSKKRIKRILNEYVSGSNQRYYNVIHWLDLGASMSRSECRKILLAMKQ